jgi:hypothetical protein
MGRSKPSSLPSLAVAVLSLLISIHIAISFNPISYFTDRIAKDERVIFFPTMASEVVPLRSNNGVGNDSSAINVQAHRPWNVSIHGWIFEPEETSLKRALFISIIMRTLKIPKTEMNDTTNSSPAFFLRNRARSFVVDNQSLKRVHIDIGGTVYRLPRSRKNGHFRATLQLTESELRLAANSGDGLEHLVPYTAKTNNGDRDNRIFQGFIHVVPSTGVSVISDIDDTIKVTDVYKGKKSLLEKTFLQAFQPVPGMAEMYQKWYQADPGRTRFHFVSSSVFQLYEDLEDFRQQHNFPPATFHLKTIRPTKLRKTLKLLTANPLATKRGHIESIISRFPHRKFVLVGDSGEKDPEVYANIAKDYPAQVKAILIRNVSGDTSMLRFQELTSSSLSDTNNITCRYFDDPTELTEYNHFFDVK